jgi:CDP-4-dehydro-6-deoxyglucose reductase, E3
MVNAEGTADQQRRACVDGRHQVIAIRRRTATIRELWLRPLGRRLDYLPGEYVLLQDRDGQIPQRSYSIANAPRRSGTISLLVTRVPGGETSTWLHDRLRLGDEVDVSGPYGTFIDDPAATAGAVYMAAGSGLAPIRALVEAALVTARRRSLMLVFSARSEREVIAAPVFRRWDSRHPQFRFISTLTQARASSRGDRRIPAVLSRLVGDLTNQHVFIAGADAFVTACAAASEALGARSAHVHTEAFFLERGRNEFSLRR